MQQLTASDFSKNLFWDIDPTTLNAGKHIKYIIARVLEAGTFDDWITLCHHYTLATIIKTAQTLRSIDPKSLEFLSTVGNVPKDKFRCCATQQLSRKHWIY